MTTATTMIATITHIAVLVPPPAAVVAALGLLVVGVAFACSPAGVPGVVAVGPALVVAVMANVLKPGVVAS